MIDPQELLTARLEGRTVPITSFSVEEGVENGTFRFAPPLIDRSPRPKQLYLMWRAFQFVFDDIPDPRSFPRLPTRPSDEDLTIFRRYIAAAEDLAESELLCGNDGVTVRWDASSGVEEVESSFTSKEITRGFAVLLRQFDSTDELASFQRVSGRLRGISGKMIDSHEPRRCQQIDAWRRAQGALHAAELQRLARRKMGIDHGSEQPPTYYLKTFNYGEWIHWDRGRDKLAEWEEDPFQRDWHRMAFLEAATGLAYLYIGFSEVVKSAVAGCPS